MGNTVRVVQRSQQGQCLLEPQPRRLELVDVDGHDAQVAQGAGDAAGIACFAGERQCLLVQTGGPREISLIVRTVAEMVEGTGQVALVAQDPPHGRGRFVPRHRLAVIAVVLRQQAGRP